MKPPPGPQAALLTVLVKQRTDSGEWTVLGTKVIAQGQGATFLPRYESWPACRCPLHRDPAE